MNRWIGAAAAVAMAAAPGVSGAAPGQMAQADPGTAAPASAAPDGALPPAGGAGAPQPADAAAGTQGRTPSAAPKLGPPVYYGTQRNNPATAPAYVTPSYGALPYGGTQATVGVPNAVAVPPYGGTLRDSVGSTLGSARVNGGVPLYTGTQSTLGSPQNLGNAGPAQGGLTAGTQPYTAQPYGLQNASGTPGGTVVTAPGAASPSGGSVQGNGTIYSRPPLGSQPYTRDQVGVYGGVGSSNARGVYTGVAPQPYAFGQIYASQPGTVTGRVNPGLNATAAIRPYVPPIDSPIRSNSGYGIPNGSKPTTMDARGIQRAN